MGRLCAAKGRCIALKASSMEKEMATHSSILAWKNPWTEESGGLKSIGLHDWACVHKGGGRWVGSNKLVELKKKKKHLLASRKPLSLSLCHLYQHDCHQLICLVTNNFTNLLKRPLCARHRARHYGTTIIFRDILPILEFIAQQAVKPASRSGLEVVLIETCSGCCFQGGWRQGLKNIKRGLHTPSISRNCFSSMGELFASEASNSKCSALILACSWDVHSCHK